MKYWAGICLLLAASVGVSAQNSQKTASTKPACTPRDAATGQASGKRVAGATDCDDAANAVKSPRDLATGQASGKQATHEVKSPRDVATGQASGKRVAAGDVNGDGKADAAAPRDAATGQATGKRQHQPVRFEKATDAQNNPTAEDKKNSGSNPLYEEKK